MGHDDSTTGKINSRIPNVRDLEPDARRSTVCEHVGLNAFESDALAGCNALPVSTANGMIENVIGKFELPLGVATNFVVNAKQYLIPMAVEEPSVVAAASFMARIAREHGGFTSTATLPIMRAQVQVINVPDPHKAKKRLLAAKDDIIERANAKDNLLVELGGGCVDIDVHLFEQSPIGPMVVLHLLVDVRDAMGANTVNTMAEAIAPYVETLTNGNVKLRILSNLADRRLVKASVEIPVNHLAFNGIEGSEVAQGIVEACALALIDPYRAATHNKGIMNGIDPIVVATGNDWRAIEAGAHAYAARNGQYASLSQWEVNSNNCLLGTLEMPMALGLVGGATKTHPAAQASIKLMNVSTASELAQVIVAVGLAQNMAALRALSTEGIQKGHMALHARNIAITAGATGADVDKIALQLAESGDVNVNQAIKLLKATRTD